MALEVQENVEIACRRAAFSRLALARHADARAIIHAGRDLDFDQRLAACPPGLRPGRSVQGSAITCAATGRSGRGVRPRKSPAGCAPCHGRRTGAAGPRAGAGLSRLMPSHQGSHLRRNIDGEFGFLAMERLFQADFHDHSADRPRAAARAGDRVHQRKSPKKLESKMSENPPKPDGRQSRRRPCRHFQTRPCHIDHRRRAFAGLSERHRLRQWP
jgi:hypothetical protein